MVNRNLREEVHFMEDLIREAEDRYLWVPPARVRDKSDYDVVTSADIKIENFLKKKIHKHYPNDLIIGEEYTPEVAVHGTCWTIDPIDGTVNYTKGIPLYGVQMALIDNEEILASVIYMPEFGAYYWAAKDMGAHIDYTDGRQKELYVKRRINLNRAIVNFGDIPHNPQKRQSQMEMMTRVADKVSKVRIYGAACYDFISIAEGRADGYVVFTKNLWDICPGILLCAEAGAKIRSLNGEHYKLGDDGLIVAANHEMLHVLK